MLKWIVVAVACAGCVAPMKLTHKMTEPVGASLAGAVVGTLRFEFTPTTEHLSFVVANTGEAPVKIIWDESAIIAPDGTSESIIHEGTKFIDRDKPQGPTVVLPRAKVSDLMAPKSRIYYTSGRYGGWSTAPMVPPAWLGKAWRAVIAIQAGADTSYHSFSFVSEKVPPAAD